jgi:hypothetical protein
MCLAPKSLVISRIITLQNSFALSNRHTDGRRAVVNT